MNEESALHLLFVCTGNICRSPIAERLTVEYCDRLQIANIAASSAGTRAVIAHPMHQEAARVLEALGGNPSDFAARQLTARVAAQADLILTMTRAHREAVLQIEPSKLRCTFALAEASALVSQFDPQSTADLASLRPALPASQWDDIQDPIAHGPDVFQAVGHQIAALLPSILDMCGRMSS